MTWMDKKAKEMADQWMDEAMGIARTINPDAKPGDFLAIFAALVAKRVAVLEMQVNRLRASSEAAR